VSGPNPLRAGGYGRVAITVQIKAVLLPNRYLVILRHIRSRGPWSTRGRGATVEKPADQPLGRSLLEPYRRVSSGPLAELRLADVVDIHPDAADAALVDLDLMQMRGRVRLATRRAPIVLPEVQAQAVVKRPFDRLGVAVHAGPLVADDGFPASQVGRDLRLILLKGRVVIDRGVDGHVGETAGGCVQLPPRAWRAARRRFARPANRRRPITVIGQADPVLSASTCAVLRCPCDSKLATTAAGAAVTTSRHTGVETPADARPTAAPSSDREISTTDA
jgi:hypothetical protein